MSFSLPRLAPHAAHAGPHAVRPPSACACFAVVRARPWSRCAALVTTASCTAARPAGSSSGCFSSAQRAVGTSSKTVADFCTPRVNGPTRLGDVVPSHPPSPWPRLLPTSVRQPCLSSWSGRQTPPSLVSNSPSGPWAPRAARPSLPNALPAKGRSQAPLHPDSHLAALLATSPAAGGSPPFESPSGDPDALDSQLRILCRRQTRGPA